MTQETARRELRADLERGMCSTCFATVGGNRVRVADHKPGCKLINDASFSQRRRPI